MTVKANHWRKLRLAGRFSLTCLLALIIIFQASSPAEALFSKQRSLFDNSIQFFNYKDQLIGECSIGAGGGVDGGVGPGVESDNVRIAYEYFVSKNLEPFRSAGIVGNLQVEAPGLNPRTNQSGGGIGRGIAQWSVNGRWRELQTFAQGRDPYDLVVQLDFIWHEMTTVPPWNKTYPAVQGATAMTGPGGATFEFMDKYEKPGVPHLDRREAAARAVLRLYGNGAPETGPPAVATPAPGSGGGGAAGGSCPATGNFTGAPGQTKPKGKGFTLNDNTDYSATPCAPGSTETQVYRHPAKGFQIRLCKIGSTGIILASIISDRAVAMINAARASGLNPNGGGFRTYEQQLATRRNNGCSVPAGPSNAGCSPPTAAPGNSQHERGLAIDFTNCGRGSPLFVWLSANSAKFGFYNYPVESWHWSTSGT